MMYLLVSKIIRKRMTEILNKYLVNINLNFKELISHLTIFKIGDDNILHLNEDAKISPKISSKLELEPISVKELKESKKNYPDFIMDVYHNKLVIEWQNLLDELYKQLLELHFSKQRTFKEIGKTKVRLDFASEKDMYNQIKENLIIDFSFSSYRDRIKVINNSFSCIALNDTVLKKIHKNILIRNSFQHKNKIVDDEFLSQTGANVLILLDKEGKEQRNHIGDEIFLYLPEIFEFKKSMIRVITKWTNHGKI